jgi:ATP-dependent helicase HepA
MFCIVKGFESLGLAKVLNAIGESWEVEYFDSPAQIIRDVRTVQKAHILIKKLGANTRIYYQHAATGQWLVGRVRQDMGDGVEVRFADKNDVYIDYENVFVRCKKPIADPVDYLANVITETPQYAEARSNFMASYISQRGATWGISALLSSIIELESHQINVIRRILNDPSQRYLLADEVGLGKTIEAGVVIRQAVLDDLKNHKVTVLVPRPLVQQWRQELTNRFGLLDFIDESVFVIPFDLLDEIDSHLNSTNLLVIDEVHHVTSGIDEQSRRLYEIVQYHSSKIERLLLLSATPVLRNESGFLRMLHLLDPIVYSLDDEDGFRTKILHRQVLAEAVASLDPQNVLYLDSILDELVEKLPTDERLIELVDALKQKLIGLPDENDPDLIDAIRILRAHLSETYRLHRRILRNRRKQVTGLTPSRSGVRLVCIPETQLERIESLVEQWRISATLMDDAEKYRASQLERVNFFWQLISTLLTNPGDITSICETRLKSIRNIPELSFEGEAQLLQDLARLIDGQQWLSSRLDCLSRELSTLLLGKAKIVVFCSQRLNADAVYERLTVELNDAVVRHEGNDIDDADDKQSPWTKFISDNSIRVIVCDQTAEEGINLQGGKKLMIHFDLPIEPNRIEQRIGRVDRYGSGDGIQSLVFLDEGSKYQKNWVSLLDSALGVFDRSISSLQYLVDDQLQQIRSVIFSEGVEAIESWVTKLKGKDGVVAKELKLIDQQDGLDELSPVAESDFETVFDIDSEWKNIRRSILYWACDTLLFSQVPEPNKALEEKLDYPFRFQYQVPGHAGQATLIPLFGFLDNFLGVLDYEDRRSTSSQPLTYPHCARRPNAVRTGNRLLRYGDDFIETLKSFSDLDDRGRSFAMWRQFHKDLIRTDSGMYFCFDFLVEGELDGAKSVLAGAPITLTDTARAAISRRRDSLFPPIIVKVWIDEEGDEPSIDFIEKYLELPYDKLGKDSRYIDTNLKSLRFRSLMDALPDTFANWGERCARMRDRAKAILLARPSLAEAKITAIKRARIEDEIREAQLATRIRMLDGVESESEHKQLELETQLNQALYQGIKNPIVKIDVAGVVILTDTPFPYVS